MIVRVARNSGFCFGVRRAVRLAEQALRQNRNKRVYSLGPLIHNPQEIERLEKQGLKVVDILTQIRRGTLIIRSHGISPRKVKQIDRAGLKVIDATCPRVRKAQQISANLRKQGYEIIIVGDEHHPEVEALRDFAGGQVLVVDSESKAKKIKNIANKKLGLVAQTTIDFDTFRAVISELLKRPFAELKIFNTICEAATARQRSTICLADKVEVMIIIGGKNSANTRRLGTLCRRRGVKTFHVEDPAQIRKDWLKGLNRVGVAAGASTPDWIIKKTVKKIKGFSCDKNLTYIKNSC